MTDIIEYWKAKIAVEYYNRHDDWFMPITLGQVRQILEAASRNKPTADQPPALQTLGNEAKLP